MERDIVLDYGDRWWKDWRWIGAIAFTLFCFGFTAFVVTTILTNREVRNSTPILERLEELNEANAQTLEVVVKQQAGVDELVAFVRDLQKRQAEDQEEVDLQIFIDLLCSSEDPVRLAACERIQQEE